MRQVKVWVSPQEMNQINLKGYPNNYSLNPQQGLVEMTITSEEFQRWQSKEVNPVQERSNSGKQLLKG